jgi:hypothetical protein
MIDEVAENYGVDLRPVRTTSPPSQSQVPSSTLEKETPKEECATQEEKESKKAMNDFSSSVLRFYYLFEELESFRWDKLKVKWDIIRKHGRNISLSFKTIDARNLPAADKNGFSDPFIKIVRKSSGEVIYRSKVIKKALEGSWDMSDEKFDLPQKESLIIQFFDKDSMASSEFLAQCEITPTFLAALYFWKESDATDAEPSSALTSMEVPVTLEVEASRNESKFSHGEISTKKVVHGGGGIKVLDGPMITLTYDCSIH